MTAQRLEKWLKAAEDKAAQDRAVSFDLADSRRPLYLLDGRGADKAHFHSLYR